MSGAIEVAELMRDRLRTAPVAGELETKVDLTKIEVIIDRQNPVLSLIEAAVAKATGTAIMITWQGFQIPDPHTTRPRLAERYTVSVWSKQVIDGANRPADKVIESIILRLWHWVPDGGHAHGEAVVRNGDMVPDKQYLIYDCEVEIPTSI